MNRSLSLQNRSSTFDMVSVLGGVQKKEKMVFLPKNEKRLACKEDRLCLGEKPFLSGMKIMDNFLRYGVSSNVAKMDILSAVSYCQEIAQAPFLDEMQKDQIRRLFLMLAELPEGKFDRRKGIGGREKLQRILSQDLDKLMSEEERDPSLAEDKQHRFFITTAKVELAYRMGVKPKETGKGANGAMFMMGLEGKPLGVFKAPSKLGLKEKMKLVFGQARLLNLDDRLGREFSEVAAAKFDAIFGFGLSPEAQMMEVQGKKGAFLEFLGGYKELSDVEKILERRKSFSDQEIIVWQTMCLHNFLIGNMDPHNENIFVLIDKLGSLLKIAMIDHGNCFIESNPGTLGAKGNQGHWGKYKLSKAKFHPQVIEFIQKQLNLQHLEEFIKWVKEERAEFWTEKMENKMRERFSVLEHVAQGSIATPEKLSCLRTNDDFKKYTRAIEVERVYTKRDSKTNF